MNTEQIINKQLEYYNNHDIEGFLSTYHSDVNIYSFGKIEPDLSGMEEMRIRYKERFMNKNLKVVINNRIVKNNIIIDEELIYGDADDVKTVIAIYEVLDNKIKKVTFIR